MMFDTFIIVKPLRTLGLTGLLCLLPSSHASPATDLYTSAVNAVQEEYFGWSQKNLSLLIGAYAAHLEERCRFNVNHCSYKVGREVLKDLFKAFGDEHTYIRDPEESRYMLEVTQNRPVFRTGLRLVAVEGGLLVSAVKPDSPAAQLGIQRLDLITEVNGQATGKKQGKAMPIGIKEFIRLERAKQNIRVVVQRINHADMKLNLTAVKLQAQDEPSLEWHGIDDKIAVIQYPSFLGYNNAKLFLKQIKTAEQAGARALVIDLRFNGGGTLTQCVAAASIFGPTVYRAHKKSESVIITGEQGQDAQIFTKQESPNLTELSTERIWTRPAAVLIGPHTASCAEVFSFFAQKAGVPLFGQETRGVANSGVHFHSLPDGGMISVTTMRAFDKDQKPLPPKLQPTLNIPMYLADSDAVGLDIALHTAIHSFQLARR